MTAPQVPNNIKKKTFKEKNKHKEKTCTKSTICKLQSIIQLWDHNPNFFPITCLCKIFSPYQIQRESNTIHVGSQFLNPNMTNSLTNKQTYKLLYYLYQTHLLGIFFSLNLLICVNKNQYPNQCLFPIV